MVETIYVFASHERFADEQLRKRLDFKADLFLGPKANVRGLRLFMAYVEVPLMLEPNEFISFSNWLTYDLRPVFRKGYEDNVTFLYSWMMGMDR